MGIVRDRLHASLDELGLREPLFAAAIARVGLPDERIRPRGLETLLRTIVGQQVSVAAAASIWRKLEAAVGDPTDARAIAAVSDDDLRAAGLSRQKVAYCRSLADEVLSGRLDLHALPADDEEAIARLVAVNGIGRWSAEIYLLFAEGREDIWPAGDLAVRIEVGVMLGHEARPGEKAVRTLAEAWRPHRGALAVFAWHHYGHRLSTAAAAAAKLPV